MTKENKPEKFVEIMDQNIHPKMKFVSCWLNKITTQPTEAELEADKDAKPKITFERHADTYVKNPGMKRLDKKTKKAWRRALTADRLRTQAQALQS